MTSYIDPQYLLFKVLKSHGYKNPPPNLIFGNLLDLVRDDLGTMERYATLFLTNVKKKIYATTNTISYI